jgi:hypothetical protein
MEEAQMTSLRRKSDQRTGILVVLAMLATVAAPCCASAQTELGFKMPSKNVYCIIEPADGSQPADLRCDIQQMNNPMPAPPRDCPLSYGDAFSITPNGASGRLVCHGDTTKNDDLPMLAYGSLWNEKGFTCRSEMSGLTCTNARGHGFSLSRANQRTF